MQNAFDEIADEWDKNRTRPSPSLALLLRFTPYNASIVLDAGCGNARNSIDIAKRFKKVIAFDLSPLMLENARKRIAESKARNIEIVQADASKLPFKDESFDAVFSLAVVHILNSKEKRLKAFEEMRRVLKPGGRALVAVWNKEQPRFRKIRGPDAVIASFAGKKAGRFYHFFSPTELRALAVKAGLNVVEMFFERGGERVDQREEAANICAVLEKARA